MPLPFTKMHGLGNDFVIIDATQTPFTLTAEHIRAMADRHFGIGFDQLLVVEPAPPSSATAVDFGYRIFNADGGEVEQCGNGARCFARYVREHGLSQQERIRVQTCAGVIELHITAQEQVRVNMGVPRFLPQQIPFVAGAPALRYPIAINGQTLMLAVANIGNPHTVLCVADVDHAPVAQWGPLLESHPRFPARVNVGFMQVLTRQHIKLRVYERGTGETMACGSGACAAVAVGQRLGLLDAAVQVDLRGGTLWIEWGGEGQPMIMQGSATRVYEGQWLWPQAA
ncbi:diaminopimelate epimerase [Sinimarinibacterium sp. NLF-5-8]|uniref:diaminopimelate epimerase n=1 Tax=Sinimarinibacterium sp. NLF-5-8 TaxID=2698684 RepID=UPI0034615AE5